MSRFRVAPATVAIAATSAFHAVHAVKVNATTSALPAFPEPATAMRGSIRSVSALAVAVESQASPAATYAEEDAVDARRASEGAVVAQQRREEQLQRPSGQALQLQPLAATPLGENSSFLGPKVAAATDLPDGNSIALDDPFLQAFVGPAAISMLISSVVALSSGAAFTAIRRRYPKIYGTGSVGTKLATPSGYHGWAKASFSLGLDDVVRHSGLDQAMLLEFAHVAMQILFSIGCITQLKYSFQWPLQYALAADLPTSPLAVSTGSAHDPIDVTTWLDAIMTWLIVLVIQKCVCRAQAVFRERRQAWLKDLPAPRATTLLVEGIPKEHCSDEKLRAFFNRLLRREVVASAHVVKHTERLLGLIEQKLEVEAKLERAMRRGRSDSPEDSTDMKPGESDASYECLREHLEQNIKSERMRIHLAAAACVDDIYTTTGFVTFKTRYDAELALSIVSKGENECPGSFACCTPPDPSDIMYSDFLQEPQAQKSQETLGYFSLLGLFVAFLPCAASAAAVSESQWVARWLPVKLRSWLARAPFTAALWDSLAGAVMLHLYLSVAPTFIAFIQCQFFRCRAEGWLQNRLQKWYFHFHVVHALLVPAACIALSALFVETRGAAGAATATAGSSALETAAAAVGDFFVRFMIIQWAGNALNMLRVFSIFWYFLALVHRRCRATPPVAAPAAATSEAKLLEPEDPDYGGLGSRSARSSFALVLCLVFSTISPVISIFGFLNFALCRLIYGYLTTYIENRKPDLGGIFWSTQMSHLQQGVLLFIFVSGSLLMGRGATRWPGLVAWASALLWYFYPSVDVGLQRSCDLKDLEEEVVKQTIQLQPSGSPYEQPELCELCFRSLIDQFDQGYLPARRGAWVVNEAG